MTIPQLLLRLRRGSSITQAQLERLERRRIRVLAELQDIDALLPRYYIECERYGRRPNPDLVQP